MLHSADHALHSLHRHPAGGPTRSPLDPDSDDVRELLEALDDAMFAAIPGDAAALRTATALWTRAVNELGWQLVEESREQYLRYAVEVTRQFEWSETRDPAKTMAAVEVIELLTRT
jgi:hypothetical protein